MGIPGFALRCPTMSFIHTLRHPFALLSHPYTPLTLSQDKVQNMNAEKSQEVEVRMFGLILIIMFSPFVVLGTICMLFLDPFVEAEIEAEKERDQIVFSKIRFSL